MGEPFRTTKPKKWHCREMNRTPLPELTEEQKSEVRTLSDTKDMTLNELDLIAAFARSFAPDSYFDPPVERTPLAAFPELRGDPPMSATHGPTTQKTEAIVDGRRVVLGDVLPAMYPEDFGGTPLKKPISAGHLHKLPPHRRNKKP